MLFDLPPEFSSKEACDLLRHRYKAPLKLLEDLVARGELLRLKRGLLVLPEQYHPLTAAASIHSPSYLSFETALAYYGLIPERVETVMSVTDNRQLRVQVSGRSFIYRHQTRELYAAGMSAAVYEGRNLLIATPEKALLDTLAWARFNTKDLSQGDVYDYVRNSLRIDVSDLEKLSLRRLGELGSLYRMKAPQMFADETHYRRKRLIK